MPYATNLPRRDRPRGLGEAADRAGSGFGTWIVDNFWGLSPKNIGGQPRPYGQTVVQTLLPRSLQPRLMNLHMGPVIPGGTWPLLRRMNNQPVFRTPVERAGAVQMSLPPGAGAGPPTEAVPHNLAGTGGGFGWIPMGVAHRPAYLLEQPGIQGYGAGAPNGGSMDPALLKRAPNLGASTAHATYYARRRDGRYVPYGAMGHSQAHSTFYSRLRGQNWIPYGAMGHSQVHSTFYSRLRGQNWTPYGGLGDFVYKPVGAAQVEVMPGAEMEAYGDYVQLPYGGYGQANGTPWGWIAVAAGVGLMLCRGARRR